MTWGWLGQGLQVTRKTDLGFRVCPITSNLDQTHLALGLPALSPLPQRGGLVRVYSVSVPSSPDITVHSLEMFLALSLFLLLLQNA